MVPCHAFWPHQIIVLKTQRSFVVKMPKFLQLCINLLKYLHANEPPSPLLSFPGAGESGKSTIVKQMKWVHFTTVVSNHSTHWTSTANFIFSPSSVSTMTSLIRYAQWNRARYYFQRLFIFHNTNSVKHRSCSPSVSAGNIVLRESQ